MLLMQLRCRLEGLQRTPLGAIKRASGEKRAALRVDAIRQRTGNPFSVLNVDNGDLDLSVECEVCFAFVFSCISFVMHSPSI